MKKLLILMLLGVLFVPMNGSAKADEVLYCQSEFATGLYPENGTWETSNFNKRRFTVKVIGDFEKVIGLDRDKEFECHYPYNWNSIAIVCHYKAGETFIYDKARKRFVYSLVSTTTYLQPDTPIMYAGTCEKF